jgi:predicted NUDIX family NTP pyrophosphohydrolase
MSESSKPVRARVSAGLLMFRRKGGALELLLVHPGGPFFQRKDDGAWTIPKGEAAPREDFYLPFIFQRRLFALLNPVQ